MSDIRKFKRAVIEATTPALRDALYGRDIDEEELQAELEYQLENRGFDVENKEVSEE